MASLRVLTRTVVSAATVGRAAVPQHVARTFARALSTSSSAVMAAGDALSGHPAGCGCPAHGGRAMSGASSSKFPPTHDCIADATDELPSFLSDVVSGNRAWAESMFDVEGVSEDEHGNRVSNYFQRTATGQAPEYAVVSCVDARVPVNQVLGLPADKVFSHRNVANMVNNSDISVVSFVDFAMLMLKGLRNIIVLGHYSCGGILAASGPPTANSLHFWLSGIRELQRQHAGELTRVADETDGCEATKADAVHKRFVELNVGEQVLNLLSLPSVQEEQQRRADNNLDLLNVTGLVLDVSTGHLKHVEVDTAKYFDMYPSLLVSKD